MSNFNLDLNSKYKLQQVQIILKHNQPPEHNYSLNLTEQLIFPHGYDGLHI